MKSGLFAGLPHVKEQTMKKILLPVFIIFFVFETDALCGRAPVSEITEECLGCHSSVHPGIAEEWQRSRHAMISPEQAMQVKGSERKISAVSVPDHLKRTAVGCAECHMINHDMHESDTFLHNGHEIHTIVSPRDCAVCHREESEQFSGNIMSHAWKNLAENPVYQHLEEAVIGKPVREEKNFRYEKADADTRAEACYYCHGTKLEVKGQESRDTRMGEMEFLQISGWPNQGIGRINPDGSSGACSACHSRHAFSIEMARKAASCRECHMGPDVPAYKVYLSSKHGNIYTTMNKDWNFKSVPWTIGKDFSAPTCAACHMSLLANTDGETVVPRTHRISDRLSWRIFGLIYAHPHPRDPDTTVIRNRAGLPLPADMDGTPAAGFLIDNAEKEKRTAAMQSVCRSCHSAPWVSGHWRRFENTIARSNADIRTATEIMNDIWARGYAKGLAQDANPFDENIERIWCDTWLFYANTIRFTSAMAGGGDYGVFADGRYQFSRQIRELQEWLDLRTHLFPARAPVAEIPARQVPAEDKGEGKIPVLPHRMSFNTLGWAKSSTAAESSRNDSIHSIRQRAGGKNHQSQMRE